MRHESITESELVSDEMQSTDSYAVDDIIDEDDDLSHPMYHTQPSLLGMIIGFFFRTPGARARDLSRRIHQLNVSIEIAPDSPSNYVLRGEIFLERKEYHLAKADFETALALAESFDDKTGWGLVEQAMQDRALDGLKQVQRRLR